jgi:hypothetical protein
VGLFVVGSGASSRSAVGFLIVSGKKPFDFRELAINFAHFQSNHRQHHNDGCQSHRKSNQYTQPLSPQFAAGGPVAELVGIEGGVVSGVFKPRII